VVLFAVALANVLHEPISSESVLSLLVFLVFIFLAEIWPIKWAGTNNEFTMTTPVIISTFLALGTNQVIVVATLSLFLAGLWSQYSQSCKFTVSLACWCFFNTSLTILSLWPASVAFFACGGEILSRGGTTTLGLAYALLVWSAVWATINMLLFTHGAALAAREPWRVVIKQSLTWYLPNYLVIGPSGILFAMLYSQYGIIGVLLIIAPFIVGRQALSQHATQLDAYRDTVTTLGSYMQYYHPYTKGHLERVADFADAIAKEMHLPPNSLMYIRNAGLLHDIGKVGVNEEVLDKVGKLTPEEWELIKQHPARGADIIAQLKFLDPIVPWIRGHHERPDGRGYPDGLNEEQIPLESAVIAVADAFDAMTGGPEDKDRRVYRTPLTVDQAIDQLRYGAGTQFDERVLKAFMRVMARRGIGNG